MAAAASVAASKPLALAQIKRERSLFLQEKSGVAPEFKIDPGDAPSQGRADAKLTVIVFGDFTGFFFAPYQETIQKAQAQYGEELRFVWRDFPEENASESFNAALAARAARLQGEDKFWAMFEVYQRAQKVMMGKAPIDFEALAAKVSGLDLERWRADFSSPSLYEQLQRELVETKRLGIVTGTPTTFINGEIVEGGQEFSVLSPVLARQFQRAEAQLAIGIDRKDLYADLVQEAYTSLADVKARIPGPDDTTVDSRFPRAPLTRPENVTFQQILVRFGGADEPYSLITRAEARRRAQLLVELARTRNIDFARLQMFYNDSPQALIEAAFPGMLVKPLEDAAFAMDNGQVSEVIESEFGFHVILRVASTKLYDSLKLTPTQ